MVNASGWVSWTAVHLLQTIVHQPLPRTMIVFHRARCVSRVSKTQIMSRESGVGDVVVIETQQRVGLLILVTCKYSISLLRNSLEHCSLIPVRNVRQFYSVIEPCDYISIITLLRSQDMSESRRCQPGPLSQPYDMFTTLKAHDGWTWQKLLRPSRLLEAVPPDASRLKIGRCMMLTTLFAPW